MRTRRWARVAIGALVVAGVATTGAIVARAFASGAGTGRVGPGVATVHLTIHHSRFEPDRIEVAPATTVTFVIDNGDPIDHEFIVGDEAVHQRHETGTEPVHPPRPGEVSIPAGTTQSTTFRFESPGAVMYACHLPGHFRYGMSGSVDVVAT